MKVNKISFSWKVQADKLEGRVLKCDLPFGSGIKRSKDSGSIYPFDEGQKIGLYWKVLIEY